jgi:flagellin
MATRNSVLIDLTSFSALRPLDATTQATGIAENGRQRRRALDGAPDQTSDGPTFEALHEGMRDVAPVFQRLNRAKGIGRVALAALTALSELNAEMRATLLALTGKGAARARRRRLIEDYETLLNRAAALVESAGFDGVNILLEATPDLSVRSDRCGGTLTLTAAKTGTSRLVPGDCVGIDRWIAILLTKVPFLLNGEPPLTGPQTALRELYGGAGDLLSFFEDYETAVLRYTPRLAADLRALDLRTELLAIAFDTTEAGLGSIVDADSARRSARLISRQIQRQLAGQPLSLANRAPRSLTGLFRPETAEVSRRP